jgi:uncharacterized protein (DUF488 family)
MKICTIGHSNRTLENFLGLLRTYGIQTVADVRAFPGSKKFPHFVKESLSQSLDKAGILYVWMGEGLGGYRKKSEGLGDDSPNKGLRNPGFRNYADYMMSAAFREAIVELVSLAEQKVTAYMCAEKLYWRCHRLLISDYLESQDHEVWHIVDKDVLVVHKLSSAARVVDGVLTYPEQQKLA